MTFTPKHIFTTWEPWMFGAAWHNCGDCWEAGGTWMARVDQDVPGAHMRREQDGLKAQVIYTQRADGVRTYYTFNRDDPFMFWQGNELDDDGNVARVKRYESSGRARSMIALMPGPIYPIEFECPGPNFWLGRSYQGDGEEEFFFVVEGSDMLREVAEFCDLPFPCSEEQAHVLDTKPELYRARHYDILGLGQGNYLPVVTASVTLNGSGQPIRLLLYTFMRPWEFDAPIVLPHPWSN